MYSHLSSVAAHSCVQYIYISFIERIILVYYNLSLIFKVCSIVSISNINNVLTKLTTEIWEHSDHLKGLASYLDLRVISIFSSHFQKWREKAFPNMLNYSFKLPLKKGWIFLVVAKLTGNCLKTDWMNDNGSKIIVLQDCIRFIGAICHSNNPIPRLRYCMTGKPSQSGGGGFCGERHLFPVVLYRQ